MPLRFYLKTHHPKAFSALKSLRSYLFSSIMAPDPPQIAPPPFDPLTPAVPISYPLKTLEELESREYFDSFHFPFNQATVDLPPDSASALPQRPRTLVCHDFAGGYTDADRFVQGGNNATSYAIWHWFLIDVFVYFSHSLVTLPPPGWTNAAHKHGVKVLGTFIMEWDEGKQQADILLSTKLSAQMYAERLTELAVALGFDGWLINMEVNLSSSQIPNLIEFVSHLSQTMHSSLPGSLVIWYDSVTIDGDLSWQNQLNEKNKPFFDVCDGIFSNYSWEEDYPNLSANAAGERKNDVYMGIDVFGRGTFGGGQWTTNVALDVIKKHNVSAAIFAPGWIYETEQPPDFQTAQKRWWGLVERSWGTVQSYPKVLPFYSNFDQGHGYHIYIDGRQVSDTPWNNIASQSFQPFLEYPGDSTTLPIQVSLDFSEASYSGGGSVSFRGTLGASEFTARLFKGELLLGDSPLLFTYTVKSIGNSLLGLAVDLSSPMGEQKSVLLAASGETLLTMSQFSPHFTTVIMPHRVTKLEGESGWVILENRIQMDGYTLKQIRAVCYKAKPEKSADANDITQTLSSSQYYAVLGDIKITTPGQNASFPPSISWLVDSQFVTWTPGPEGSKHLSAKITWQLTDGNSRFFPKYDIYVNKLTSVSPGNHSELVEGAQEYLGGAVVKSFYISQLEIPCGTHSLKFIIQVFDVDGTGQKLEDCPFYLLEVQGA